MTAPVRDAALRPARPARHLLAATLSLAALVLAGPAAAATCSVSAQGVNFGSYDFTSNQPLDSVGHVLVTCDTSTSYTIALSPGTGTFTNRILQSGTNQLLYNLYTDTTHQTIWGDGSSGTMTVSGSSTNGDYPVYGRVPAGQNPYVGSYSDAITVTLTY